MMAQRGKIMINNVLKIGILSIILALSACGDSGGDRAEGVQPGPPPSGGNPPVPPVVTPPTAGEVSAADIQASDMVAASAKGIFIGQVSANKVAMQFNIMVNETNKVSDLSSQYVRFTLAKLVKNPGSSHGDSWQSYIEVMEDPICRDQADIDNSSNACISFTADTDPNLIPDSARKVQHEFATGKIVTAQASSENTGNFNAEDEGDWLYDYSVDFSMAMDSTQTHRACLQLSFAASVDNICIDFVPAEVVSANDGTTGTSLSTDFYTTNNARKIVTEKTCNTCHSKLAIHGGGRTQTDYCVTCHNPGSTDANSGNSIDFKQLVHKIHFGQHLPSLIDDGKPYIIWGFRNSNHDFSGTTYPQEVINCNRCHAGEEDIEFNQAQKIPAPSAMLTDDGYNWVINPTKMACQSCHEKLFAENKKLNGNIPTTNHTEFTDEKQCAGCHRDRGAAEPGSLQPNQAHRDSVIENALTLAMNIIEVTNTGPNESPIIKFSVTRDGEALDIKAFNGKVIIGVAWDAAADYDNDGLSGFDALNIEIKDTIDKSTALGNNIFQLDLSTIGLSGKKIALGQDTIAVIMIGHEVVETSPDEIVSPMKSQVAFYASEGSIATPRREVVDTEKCNSCHNRLANVDGGHQGFHAAPGDNVQVCIACHGSNLGFFGETADFRYLIHAVHASEFRENEYRPKIDDVLFPGDLADCQTCHKANTHQLPLAFNTPITTGTSGLFTSPTATVCSSCHDSDIAKAHMESAGGAQFSVDKQLIIDNPETCSVCHGPGKTADVDVVHKEH
jgi:OmcA/MtrC family decaheme c-type cytochrome